MEISFRFFPLHLVFVIHTDAVRKCTPAGGPVGNWSAFSGRSSLYGFLNENFEYSRFKEKWIELNTRLLSTVVIILYAAILPLKVDF